VGVQSDIYLTAAMFVFVDELDRAELGFGGVDPEATGRPSYHPSDVRCDPSNDRNSDLPGGSISRSHSSI
jgi:hypothetical protein